MSNATTGWEKSGQLLRGSSLQPREESPTLEEIKLRAERWAGELLKDEIRSGGDRKSKSRSQAVTLIDMGISRNQSSKWQKIASITENLINTNQR